MLKRKAEKQKERRQLKKHNSNGSNSPVHQHSPTATTPTAQPQNTPTHVLPITSLNSPGLPPNMSMQHHIHPAHLQPGMQSPITPNISNMGMGQSIHQHMTMPQQLPPTLPHNIQQQISSNMATQMHQMNSAGIPNVPNLIPMVPQQMNTEMEK